MIGSVESIDRINHGSFSFLEFDAIHRMTVADIIRICLGPKAVVKMLMDPMGGIVMTNDGNAILHENVSGDITAIKPDVVFMESGVSVLPVCGRSWRYQLGNAAKGTDTLCQNVIPFVIREQLEVFSSPNKDGTSRQEVLWMKLAQIC